MANKVILKSVAASFLISVGVAVLLSSPLFGPFLFAVGLLTICSADLYLFTGKCGYALESPQIRKQLFPILITNLISGWFFGFLLSFTNPQFTIQAIEKVNNWSWSIQNFIQAIYCGGIMYVCVELHKRNEKLGILYGVPVFILCGFQHCIANSIILGVARTFDWVIILHIIGNFLGALMVAFLFNQGFRKSK